LAVARPPSSPATTFPILPLLFLPRAGNGLARVQYDNSVGIDGGDLLDQLVLIAGESEDWAQTGPNEDDGYLAFLAAAMAASWSALRCSGVYQFRRTWTGAEEVSGCGDLDGVRAGGQLDRPADIIDSVGVGTVLSWLAWRMSPWTPP